MKEYSKEIYQFTFDLVSSPVQAIQKRQNLSWQKIAIYFASVSIVANFFGSIFGSHYFWAIGFPIEMTISQMVYFGITLWVSVLVLRKKELVIDERELAEVWLKALILSVLASCVFSALRIYAFSAMGVLMALVPTALVAGSTYIYMTKCMAIENSNAKNLSWTVAGIVGIIPLLGCGGMVWGVHSLLRY